MLDRTFSSFLQRLASSCSWTFLPRWNAFDLPFSVENKRRKIIWKHFLTVERKTSWDSRRVLREASFNLNFHLFSQEIESYEACRRSALLECWKRLSELWWHQEAIQEPDKLRLALRRSGLLLNHMLLMAYHHSLSLNAFQPTSAKDRSSDSIAYALNGGPNFVWLAFSQPPYHLQTLQQRIKRKLRRFSISFLREAFCL